MREIGGEMLVSVYAMTDLDCISIFKAFGLSFVDVVLNRASSL